MKRIPIGNGYVRSMRVNTTRKIRDVEGVDQMMVIVSDCYVDEAGERNYPTPQDVEDAIDHEELDWSTARRIVEFANSMFGFNTDEDAKKN